MINGFVGYLLMGVCISYRLSDVIKTIVLESRQRFEEKYGIPMSYSETTSYWIVFTLFTLIWPIIIPKVIRSINKSR